MQQTEKTICRRHLMSESWVTRALSTNSTPVEINDDILEEKGVVLLQGTNVYGDSIYSYLELTIKSMQQLRESMRKGAKFLPGDFGEVIAAGNGEPSAELRAEMAVTYNLVDTPKQHRNPYQNAQNEAAQKEAVEKAAQMQQQQQPQSPQQPSANFSQPSIWDD